MPEPFVEDIQLARHIKVLYDRGVTEVQVLAVDCDGTLTKANEYPNLGEFREGALDALRLFQRAGGKVLLWTCRQGRPLAEALDAMDAKGFVPDWVNSPTIITQSYKPYYDLLIDDRALGCPLDWGFIGRLLTAMAPKDRNWFKRWKAEGGSA